jgi:hypothetical protein
MNEYCHNKLARENFTFIIENGIGRYKCGTTQEQIDNLYPVPSVLFYQEPTNDSPNWMRDI